VVSYRLVEDAFRQINNRKILDGIFETCGVPPEKIRTISSAVDKLDKVRLCIRCDLRPFIQFSPCQLPWEDVKKEMTDEKGLSSEVADKIGEYVKLKGQTFPQKTLSTLGVTMSNRTGGPSLLDQLKADETLMSNRSAKDGILEMELLFTLLGAYKVLDKVWRF
jgi:histidyl-tRNA synthetase